MTLLPMTFPASRHRIFFAPGALALAFLFLAITGPGLANEGQEPPPNQAETETKVQSANSTTKSATDVQTEKVTRVNELVQVIGGAEQAQKVPGSAFFITKQDLERQGHSDIHRVLRQVPGINIQEEDGYGLRPNIGMRGTGVERSQKITLMEDGVLIAPAPYTAPAAYYFPTTARMESIEVLKGPSSIKNGPYTNGGALNLISSSVPGHFSALVNAAGGSDNHKQLRASIGDSKDRWGYLIETFQLNDSGFKNLDTSGETGVTLRDFMGKLRFIGAGAYYQSVELKLGKTTQDGDETYLGLTESDFRSTPLRRYAGSQRDQIETDHKQVQLRHFIKPAENLDITTTIYYNDFFRDWYKNEATGSVSNATILANPELYGDQLALLRGERDSGQGDNDLLTLRHNRRNYYSKGIQTQMFMSGSLGKTNHDLEAGIRYHEDEEDRLQADDLYRMTGGELVLSQTGAVGSQTNRVSDAQAVAIFVKDTIALGHWTFSPGVRYETIDYSRFDYSTSDPDRSLGATRTRKNEVDVVLPGLGIDRVLSPEDRILFGVHRGFSPPGAGQNADTREERSLNYELGYRHIETDLRVELIGFFNDYSNLLGTETLSGGGDSSGSLYNAGAVDIKGLETFLSYNLAQKTGFSIGLPLSLTYTYTATEFKSSFATDFEDWAPQVSAGDHLPYLPEHQATLELGVTATRWDLNLSANYASALRSKAGSGPIPTNERIDDRIVVDLAAGFRLGREYRVYGQVRNLLDESYLVARRPYGLRPGLPRTLVFGVSAQF